jgi:hypothetical protein
MIANLSNSIASSIAAVTALLACNVCVGATKTVAPPWKTECFGYYTLKVPGELEYALKPNPFYQKTNAVFENKLSVMGVDFRVKTDRPITNDGISDSIKLMQAVDTKEFTKFKDVVNKIWQTERDELLQSAERTTSQDSKESYLEKASRINLHESYSNKTALAAVIQQVSFVQTPDVQVSRLTPALDFYVQVNEMTIHATRKLNGTPQQTIDKFLSHFRSRAAFEVPTTPGVCLPYAFMSGEAEPADTGTAMRLKDHPDILIYLKDVEDYSKAYIPSKPVPSAKIFVEVRARTSFNFGDAVDPLDGTLRPTRSVKIDGREGAGAFVKITRKPAAGADAINNEDWGYLAYIPADKKAPAGTSSDLIFRVERFNRFAKQPMTEKEFRQLVMTLAAGIKRRPGAFLAK